MYSQLRQKCGYSLVELLVTMVIFAIFSGAVYSLYITQLKTAYSREDTMDVQQNVRIAMDRLTRDIRMAGLFVSPPFDITMTNISSISIQTTPLDTKRVTISQIESDDKFFVTPAATLASINIGANAIIIRSNTMAQIGGTFSVLSSSTATGHFKVSPVPPDSPASGDMVLNTTTTYPQIIRYRIDRTDTSHGCDKSPCLLRNNDIIAQGINRIRFKYYLGGVNNSSTTAFSNITSINRVSALQVTVTGQTSKNITRELVTFVKLRNYRGN